MQDNTCQKIVQAQLLHSLVDLIVLRLVNQEPKYGYQIIQDIRKAFGIYFGTSTIYPILIKYEKKVAYTANGTSQKKSHEKCSP